MQCDFFLGIFFLYIIMADFTVCVMFALFAVYFVLDCKLKYHTRVGCFPALFAEYYSTFASMERLGGKKVF